VLEADTEKVAVWPAVMVRLTGWLIIVGSVTPMPPAGIITDAVNWSLVREMLPEALPVTSGVKLAENVVPCPLGNVIGNDGPVTVKPPPDAMACEIVTAIVPEFVIVKFCLLVEPTATLPKLRLAGLAEMVAVDGDSVSVVGAVPSALVKPTHPDWAIITNKTASKIK